MYNILTDDEVAHLFSLFKDTQNTFIQKVVKALPDLIYVMDLDTHAVIYSSRLIAQEVGYSAQEIDDMVHPILDILHPDDKERFLLHLQDIKNCKAGDVLAIEFRLIRHDGSIAWFIDRNTIFTRKPNGIPLTKIGISHQITDRKEKEERLLKHEKINGQTELLAGTGSWAYDCPTKSFTWSPGMYKLFNLPSTAAVQPSIYKEYCIEQDVSIAERIVNHIEQEQCSFEEILRIDVNGMIRSLKIKADPLFDEQSACSQIVGVDLDITSTEQQLQQLQRLNIELESKNREIQSLHNDLKTFSQIAATDYHESLKNIYSFLESVIIRQADKFDNSQKAALRKTQSLIQRLNLKTDDIISYLNLSANKQPVAAVSLDEVVKNVLGDLHETILHQNILIEMDVLGIVSGDVELIYLLFRNLIENAIKFKCKDRQAVIRISSSRLAATEIQDYIGDVIDFLCVGIEDNGVGFDPSESEQIFELFYKNHNELKLKGSGVGLAVSKKIMNIHRGFIKAESKLNEGCRVICYFPRTGALKSPHP